jgi:hypothetical protein
VLGNFSAETEIRQIVTSHEVALQEVVGRHDGVEVERIVESELWRLLRNSFNATYVDSNYFE